MEKVKAKDIALDFAIEITKVCDTIKGRDVFIKQLLRSASSIGANLHEAQYAQSDLDLINKIEIALKECNETEFWLKMLYKLGSISKTQYDKFVETCISLRRIMVASIKKIKLKMM